MSSIRPGNIFIVSAASGTGKTTLVSRLVKQHDDIRVSVSHTTRPPREGEVHGRHYYFVDRPKFEQLIGEGAFLEFADVYGNYYGTSVEGVRQLREQGFDVILEIDTQGAQQIRRLLPEAVGIFILPPSFDVLHQRLTSRNSDSSDTVAVRTAKAREEIEQSLLFDYIVVNDDLIAAEADLLHIIKSCRLKLDNRRQCIVKLLQSA